MYKIPIHTQQEVYWLPFYSYYFLFRLFSYILQRNGTQLNLVFEVGKIYFCFKFCISFLSKFFKNKTQFYDYFQQVFIVYIIELIKAHKISDWTIKKQFHEHKFWVSERSIQDKGASGILVDFSLPENNFESYKLNWCRPWHKCTRSRFRNLSPSK